MARTQLVAYLVNKSSLKLFSTLKGSKFQKVVPIFLFQEGVASPSVQSLCENLLVITEERGALY